MANYKTDIRNRYLDLFLGAALTKYHKLGVSNHKNVLSYGFGGEKSNQGVSIMVHCFLSKYLFIFLAV